MIYLYIYNILYIYINACITHRQLLTDNWNRNKFQLIIQLTFCLFIWYRIDTRYMIYVDKGKNLVSTVADINRWSLRLALTVANLDKYRDGHCQHTEETKENTDVRVYTTGTETCCGGIITIKGVGKARRDKSARAVLFQAYILTTVCLVTGSVSSRVFP